MKIYEDPMFPELPQSQNDTKPINPWTTFLQCSFIVILGGGFLLCLVLRILE